MTDCIHTIATVLGDAGSVAAKDVSQIQKLIGNFGIDAPFLIAQILNFCIVAFVIYYFGFKPVLATIDLRQKKISDGLQYAEEMKSRLADAERQYSEKMAEAARESQEVLQDARDTAKAYNDRQMQEAATKAEAAIKKAQESIELERQKMLAEARKEVAHLVVATSAKVLDRDLAPEEAQKFSESAAKEIYAQGS